MTTPGETIKRAREKKGMTQEELARALNTTKSAISRYEKDKRQPRSSVAEKIAEILNLELVEVYFGCTSAEFQDRIKKEEQDYWEEMDSIYLPGLTKDLVSAFSLLNEEGQQKAVERVEELTEIPKYKKDPPQD